MLFEEEKIEPRKASRPALPADVILNYQIGFLFNFNSGKSTRFDFEPILILGENGKTEYKRISLQVERGLAYLHTFDDAFYNHLLQFSDNKLTEWMTRTGNRFIRNVNTGSWAHTTSKGLVNLRKHYRDLLENLWPTLSEWPHLFILKSGRFSNVQQQKVKLSQEPPKIRLSFDVKADTLFLTMALILDGQEAKTTIRGGFLLEKDNTLYLPNAETLAILDTF